MEIDHLSTIEMSPYSESAFSFLLLDIANLIIQSSLLHLDLL